tara:strand:+ start:253 stop:921 length:669 start_codon:yes stop_codon:yes gene_type:complete
MKEKTYDYEQEKFQFQKLFEHLFRTKDLQKLHLKKEEKYDLFTAPGNDSDTIYHKIFYDKMRSGWPEFLSTYKKFIKEFIAPQIQARKSIIYQRWPSFRVHLPENVAVGGWHCDGDYNHPPGEMNFILALTPMFESNTTILESSPGKRDFHQLELKPGQVFYFNGNQCMHGNLPNRTNVTRVSFDFRVLLPEDYDKSYQLTSLSKNNKFLIGEYYEIMELGE